MTDTPSQPAGWYYAQGDPPGTQRYWDGSQWQGGPQTIPTAAGTTAYGVQSAIGEIASPWARLGARIVDGIILLVPFLLVLVVIGGGLYGFGADADLSFGAQVLSGVITTVIAVAYEFYFLAKDGATPGKKVANVKVVREDGSPLGQDGAAKRLLLTALQAIPLLGSLLNLVVGLATIIMIFTDSRRQVPADKVAKSIVIRT